MVNLGDIRTEHALAYRNSLTGARNYRAKQIFRLIVFFEFWVEMGWLQRNIARAQSVILRYDDQQTPKALTEAQFETLLAAVGNVNGRTTDGQRRKLKAMLLLMKWTGLALRDAVCIERAPFGKSGDGFYKMFLRRAKTNHPVYCTLRSDTVEKIFAGANSTGRYLFIDYVPEGERELDAMVQSWGVLFRKLGEIAKLEDENSEPYRFTSHALRHSFVFWALNNGLPTEDVAMLIGDSVQIVAKHYSEWILGRQARLDERMRAELN